MNFIRNLVRSATLVFIFLSTGDLLATNYYVRKDGSNANTGLADTSGGAKLTVQAAVNLANTPGDIVHVRQGVYAENVDSVHSGSAGNYITIEGYGRATITRFDFNSGNSYVKLSGMKIGPHAKSFQVGNVQIYDGASYGWITGCRINCGWISTRGINWEEPDTVPYGTAGSNFIIENTIIEHAYLTDAVQMFGDDNIFRNNTIEDIATADFLTLFGRRNIIQGNVFRNNIYRAGGGNHPDFIQTFGNNGFGSEDHIIEGNIIDGVDEGQLGQMEAGGASPPIIVPEIGGWIFRNNLFMNIALQSSCTMPNTKWYNNVFYRCNKEGGGAALVFGSRAYGPVDSGTKRATQSGNTVTATGSIFTAAMVGDTLYFDTGEFGIITAFTDSTHVDVDTSQTVTNQLFEVGGPVDSGAIRATQSGTTITATAAIFTSNMVGHIFLFDSGERGTITAYTDTTHVEVSTSWTVTSQLFLVAEFISFADGTEVKNNVFLDCGDFRSSAGWYSFGDELQGVVADYNYVGKRTTNDWGAPFDSVDVGTVAVGTIVDGQGTWDFQEFYEPNGINGGDPGFRDIEGFDFTPVASSVLREAGDTLADVTDDFAGTARPVGADPDIGMIEGATASVGTTRYVATTGNDTTGDGTVGNPYRTIQKGVNVSAAGDTVSVTAGAYGENVESLNSGTAVNPITILGVGSVSTRGFRANGEDYITLDNLTFTGIQNTWDGHVRIEPTSDYIVVRNCHFGPGVYAMSNDMTFDPSDDSINSPTVDFVAEGFIAGGLIYYGGTSYGEVYLNSGVITASQSGTTITASSGIFTSDMVGMTVIYDSGSTSTISAFTSSTQVTSSDTRTVSSSEFEIYEHNHTYPDHNQTNTIATVSTNKITLVTPLTASASVTAWAPVYASSSDASGNAGVVMISSGGLGPTHCTITHCTMDDLFGAALSLKGNDHVASWNTITNNNSFWGCQLNGFPGKNYRIERNIWRDTPNTIINYTQDELDNVPHPTGATWFDYSVGFLSIQNPASNIYFIKNWIQDLDQPLTQWSEFTYNAATEGSLDFADNDPSADTITRASGSWLSAHPNFRVGARIIVRGSGNNDGIYTIASSTATVITLSAEDTLYTQTGDATAFIAGSFDLRVFGNVFVGCKGSVSAGLDNMKFIRNTFYRVSFGDPYTVAMTIGGNAPDLADRIQITENAFLDCGNRENFANEGAYSVVSASNTYLDRNYIAGPETAGWPAKTPWSETLGVNGGNPVYYNLDNPLGVDQLPFTPDDGIRVLPNSPLLDSTTQLAGKGALRALNSSDDTREDDEPLAHFTVSDISTGLGWKDVVGNSWNPVWLTSLPYDRETVVRPWDTPESFGDATVTVTFDASKSLDELSLSNLSSAGLTSVVWKVNNVTEQTGTSLTFVHDFTAPGEYDVALTVTNSAANTDTISKTYRIPGEEVDPSPGGVPRKSKRIRIKGLLTD